MMMLTSQNFCRMVFNISDFGCWISDFGFRILGFGVVISDFGFLDFRFLISDWLSLLSFFNLAAPNWLVWILDLQVRFGFCIKRTQTTSTRVR